MVVECVGCLELQVFSGADPGNKKQCSRQLQCEVPCSVGNIVNSSLFINSSWSPLSSTSQAIFAGGGCLALGGSGHGGVWPQGGSGHGGVCPWGGGAGDILV